METTHEGLVLLQLTDVSDREMEDELSSEGDGQVGESLSSIFIQPTHHRVKALQLKAGYYHLKTPVTQLWLASCQLYYTRRTLDRSLT